MKKILATFLITLASFSYVLFFSPPAFACTQSTLGIPHWYRGLVVDGSCNIDPDIDPEKFASIVVLNVGEILARLIGYVAFGMIIYGGFRYVLSAGLASNVESAKKIITNSIIGLLISLLATTIVNIIFGAVVG